MGASPPELAAAVSNAGGLGMLGTARVGGDTVPGLERLLDHPGADLPPLRRQLPDPPSRPGRLPSRLRRAGRGWSSSSTAARPGAGRDCPRRGALVSWQVGSKAEAVAAAEAGATWCRPGGRGRGPRARAGRRAGPAGRGARGGRGCRCWRPAASAPGGRWRPCWRPGPTGRAMGTRFVAAAEVRRPLPLRRGAARGPPRGHGLRPPFICWSDAPGRVLRSCVEAARGLRGEVVGETEVGGGHRRGPGSPSRPRTEESVG